MQTALGNFFGGLWFSLLLYRSFFHWFWSAYWVAQASSLLCNWFWACLFNRVLWDSVKSRCLAYKLFLVLNPRFPEIFAVPCSISTDSMSHVPSHPISTAHSGWSTLRASLRFHMVSLVTELNMSFTLRQMLWTYWQAMKGMHDDWSPATMAMAAMATMAPGSSSSRGWRVLKILLMLRHWIS